MILRTWSISNGILHGRKKRVRAIRFFQLKTEKTEMGYTFLTAVDTEVNDESKKKFFVLS